MKMDRELLPKYIEISVSTGTTFKYIVCDTTISVYRTILAGTEVYPVFVDDPFLPKYGAKCDIHDIKRLARDVQLTPDNLHYIRFKRTRSSDAISDFKFVTLTHVIGNTIGFLV